MTTNALLRVSRGEKKHVLTREFLLIVATKFAAEIQKRARNCKDIKIFKIPSHCCEMEAILDTNFILHCLMKGIDFLSELREMGFVPVVPREVLQELKDLRSKDKVSHKERTAISLALEMLSSKEVKKIKLGEKSVDEGLIKKGREGVHIATLDREIKAKVPNKIVIRSAKKRLEVERD
ncbi:hypothetical protein D6817_01705 [Candidatus Pacearchaeota archaeon]|nr:MAG: hypothetical protein D6817_01705 [Candidatus Pacearchaeota archaeon]